MAAKRPTPLNVLQEYLEALADAEQRPDKREEKMLTSWAELQFRLHGGGRCAICHASVRHVLPVRAEHLDGSTAEYKCLCTRCLQAERMISERLVMRVGRARLEFRRAPEERKATQKFKAIRLRR